MKSKIVAAESYCFCFFFSIEFQISFSFDSFDKLWFDGGSLGWLLVSPCFY